MLLVKIPNNLRNIVFDIPHVRRYLFWKGQPAVVREDEVQVLRKVADQEFSSVTLQKFAPGTKLDLTPSGSLFISKNNFLSLEIFFYLKRKSDIKICWISSKKLELLIVEVTKGIAEKQSPFLFTLNAFINAIVIFLDFY